MKNYEITEEQIKELAKGNAKVKNWFPEVFETKLEVGKWYKDNSNSGSKYLVYVSEAIGKMNENESILGYGFSDNAYWAVYDCNRKAGSNTIRLATDTEVLEALTNEAKKRGLVEGAYFIEPENCEIYSDEIRKCVGEVKIWNNINTLCFSGSQSLIFKNGIWATVVKTYTKEEAEKVLNAKII